MEPKTTFCSDMKYETACRLDHLRKHQYGYLDDHSHVYLDYAGAGLAARCQIDAHHARVSSYGAGNPHSVSPASELSNELIAKTKARVLKFLNASPEEYTVIFTANATGAIRLVGEAYAFGKRSRLVLTEDNHNSMQGLRCYAKQAGARVTYVPVEPRELRTDTADVVSALSRPRRCIFNRNPHRGLFAYPAQSNFTGVRHPLSWVKLAQDKGYDVLLDAAAYLPTTKLDLSVVKPDFTVMSWYKLFGFPTGVGCLVARRSALSRLSRPWFSGGTVEAALVGLQWHTLVPGAGAFEDGTTNFLSIPDVHFGIEWIEQIGMDVISDRVRYLTAWVMNNLQHLTHDNGRKMVRIYGPQTMQDRGGTVAFNLVDAEGRLVDERLVAEESAGVNISLRTGCFCNPGAGEAALKIRKKDIIRVARDNGWIGTKSVEMPHRPFQGAVRISFGVASTLDDAKTFMDFVNRAYRNRVIYPKELLYLEG
ncbi:hypothetical protein ACO1O0_003787 [Amphichorda felina]